MTKRKPAAKRKVGKEQVEAFRETARKVGADQPASIDDVMKRLAGQKRSVGSKKKE